MATERGTLVVLSGPSGCGKSTVIALVQQKLGDLAFSVSATTRQPREGEREGVDYYFVTRETFSHLVAAGDMLEHAEYVGNCYGTPRRPVELVLQSGRDMILDIEVQGAAQVKDAMPEAVTVFLAPPSLSELEARLRGRGTDSPDKIAWRLETARREMAQAKGYEYLVINRDAEQAAQELCAILAAVKCRTQRRIEYLKEVLES